MENGLRVGLTGIITPFVTQFESAENMAGITVTDAFAAAWSALSELRHKTDLTICIYHGGFEADVKTGEILSQTSENQGCRICRELGFDILLAAHQHMEAENLQIGGTYTCQPPEKAAKFIRMNITADRGSVHAVSRLVPAGDQPLPAAMEAIGAYGKAAERVAWYARRSVGYTASRRKHRLRWRQTDRCLQTSSIRSNWPLRRGHLRDEPFQSVSDFPQNVTIRAIICAYAFPNTLKTIRVTRKVSDVRFGAEYGVF